MGSKRILLVDDEVVLTDRLTALLENRGYEVKAVDNGKDALRALGEAPFDAVALDLKMPGMDGITTLKEIGQLGLFTQTIFLTGHGTSETAAKAKELGALDFLSKPFELNDLVSSIEIAVKKKRRIETQSDLDKMIRG